MEGNGHSRSHSVSTPKRSESPPRVDLGSPRKATNTLAQNAVQVRDAAKWIGRALVKLGQAESVMIVTKLGEPSLALFTRSLALHMIETPRACSRGGLCVYVDAKLEKLPLFDYPGLMYDYPTMATRLKFWTPELCATQGEKIDFIITIGGDGTVLYAAWLFQYSQVPPVIPFHLGSLGFLTLFSIKDTVSVLARFIGCSKDDGIRVNMRMRLSCTVWRYKSRLHSSSPGRKVNPLVSRSTTLSHHRPNTSNSLLQLDESYYVFAKSPVLPAASSESDLTRLDQSYKKAIPSETFQILNELVVDRGPSGYLSQLELYVDDRHLTTVQADGLVVATPTGSTAYSLSAGGCLTHPEVNSFLITPVCPHTLSFRPMLLPDSVELRIQIPSESRSSGWASFDGRHRIELATGDYITVSMSRLPMPTVCMDDQSSDWFEALRRCLHWNERAKQKAFSSSVSEDIVRDFKAGMTVDELATRILDL